MLEYMYTGRVDFVKGKNILPILSLSNYYGVLSLKQECELMLGYPSCFFFVNCLLVVIIGGMYY